MSFCFYCGVEHTPSVKCISRTRLPKGTMYPPTMATKDHIVARCNGGRRTVPACYKCKVDKGRLTLEEWRIVCAFRKIPELGAVVAGFRFVGEVRGVE